MTPPNPPHGIEPCPFCGEVPTHRTSGGLTECTNADCPIEVKAFSVEDWNTRAALQSPHTGLTDVERVIRKLAKQLYAHHAIKYDPAAEEQCIQNAIATLSNTSVPVTVSEWKPIETAPKDLTEVLIFCPEYGVTVAQFECHAKPPFWSVDVWDLGEHAEPARPTYWMPLPEPPGLAMSADNREGR